MNILILGPAGSGKSLMTREFGQYLEMNYSTRRINLDPGAVKVPYEPDFDIRENFTLEQIMAEEDLGPNGATLEAIDRMAELRFPKFEDDFVLMDTPGQLEPFVFRGGIEAFREYADNSVFLIDGTAPLNTFPSQYLYSLATEYAINLPMVRVLNKVDLMSAEKLEELERMIADPRMFWSVEDVGMRSQLNMDVADLLIQMDIGAQVPSVSAKTREGFENLAADMFRSIQVKEDVDLEFPTEDYSPGSKY